LERGGSIDWIGFSTFTLSVASFLLSLTFAAYGSGGQFATYLLVVLGAASLVVFVLYERKIEHPILDLKLLGIREFTGGVVAQLLNAISWGAVLLLLSLYFQIVLNLSPLEAGLRMIPLEVGVVLFGPLSGKLSDRFGHLPFTTSGLVMSSSALLLLSTTDTSTPYYHIAVYILLLGAGIGVFTAPNVSSIMSSVPPARRGIASAFRIVLFNVGFTISLNLAILIMTFTVPYELVTSLVSSVNPLSVPEVERELFSEGLKQTYLSLAVLNTVAIAPSLLRGKRIRNDELKTSTEEK
jgi:MFS family permease